MKLVTKTILFTWLALLFINQMVIIHYLTEYIGAQSREDVRDSLEERQEAEMLARLMMECK